MLIYVVLNWGWGWKGLLYGFIWFLIILYRVDIGYYRLIVLGY